VVAARRSAADDECLPLDVRLLHGFTHRFVWDGGPVHVDGTVVEGDRLAGFEVVDLSGHAPGLIGLWRERDRVALVSDCFYMNDMHRRPQPPSVPLDAYNLDTAKARRSIRKLAELRPAIACPGTSGSSPEPTWSRNSKPQRRPERLAAATQTTSPFRMRSGWSRDPVRVKTRVGR
jgi:glyoxylase-like metal-dependent hydrolase (beta-lactamase superfamily II)